MSLRQFTIVPLQMIVANNPGDCADKVEDGVAKAMAAFEEFDKMPPDNEAALGNMEGAVGDLEAAVNDGECTMPSAMPPNIEALMDGPCRHRPRSGQAGNRRCRG